MKKPCSMEFDGYPRRVCKGRIPAEQRPKTGEIWLQPVLEEPVLITKVDPYGRWFCYERVEFYSNYYDDPRPLSDYPDGDYVVKFGTIGQTDLMRGDAYRLDGDE